MSATQGPSGAARIEDTVKDFWATRPRRPRRGRKIAGVAAGIANRYRIDPVLVRVGFAVAAIYGGAGVLVYLLGWLFLPEQDDEVSPIESLFGKGRSSTSSGFTVLLGIIMVPTCGWFFSGSFTGEFSSWMSLLVVGGLLFLLHQSRGHVVPVNPSVRQAPEPPPAAPVPPTMPFYPQPPVPPQPPTPHSPNESYVPPASEPVYPPPPAEEQPRTTPPAWDPLGAAPFAWDLPEPAVPEPEEPEPPRKRRKPRVATATLGLALMAVAGLALTGISSPGIGWVSPHHVVGVVLAIIGLGLVFGAFLRAGRGLIALAVPLSVAGMAMTVISPGGYHGLGDLTATPTSVHAVKPLYERSVGSITLDLTDLPETADRRPVVTQAHTDVGSVTVLVPETANVTVSCKADTGSVDCLGHEKDGIDSNIDEFTDLGSDGTSAGMDINLEVSADIGDVEVRRG